MVTIADVAKRAGVSMMTVSRVINKSSHVSEKTREKVEEAIRHLNYRPNMVARSLATSRNQMVAYVISDLANPFFANVSTGIQRRCMEKGYTMILFDVSNGQQLDECLNMLIDHRIDGVIFHHLDVSMDQAERLYDNGLKCVMIDNERDLEGVTTLESDDYLGARMAVRHLIERGHRRIGCIHGLMSDEVAKQSGNLEYIETFQRRIWRNRTRGFLDEMSAAGLEPACMLQGRATANIGFFSGGSSRQRISGMQCMPTALYCENDMMALGVLGECLERDVRVPGDMAIVGHDGIKVSLTLYPRVTTVNQPKYEMGVMAAEKLIDAIEGRAQGERIMIRSQLAIGDTT